MKIEHLLEEIRIIVPTSDEKLYDKKAEVYVLLSIDYSGKRYVLTHPTKTIETDCAYLLDLSEAIKEAYYVVQEKLYGKNLRPKMVDFVTHQERMKGLFGDSTDAVAKAENCIMMGGTPITHNEEVGYDNEPVIQMQGQKLYTRGEVVFIIEAILQMPDQLMDAVNDENTDWTAEDFLKAVEGDTTLHGSNYNPNAAFKEEHPADVKLTLEQENLLIHIYKHGLHQPNGAKIEGEPIHDLVNMSVIDFGNKTKTWFVTDVGRQVVEDILSKNLKPNQSDSEYPHLNKGEKDLLYKFNDKRVMTAEYCRMIGVIKGYLYTLIDTNLVEYKSLENEYHLTEKGVRMINWLNETPTPQNELQHEPLTKAQINLLAEIVNKGVVAKVDLTSLELDELNVLDEQKYTKFSRRHYGWKPTHKGKQFVKSINMKVVLSGYEEDLLIQASRYGIKKTGLPDLDTERLDYLVRIGLLHLLHGHTYVTTDKGNIIAQQAYDKRNVDKVEHKTLTSFQLEVLENINKSIGLSKKEMTPDEQGELEVLKEFGYIRYSHNRGKYMITEKGRLAMGVAPVEKHEEKLTPELTANEMMCMLNIYVTGEPNFNIKTWRKDVENLVALGLIIDDGSERYEEMNFSVTHEGNVRIRTSLGK